MILLVARWTTSTKIHKGAKWVKVRTKINPNWKAKQAHRKRTLGAKPRKKMAWYRCWRGKQGWWKWRRGSWCRNQTGRGQSRCWWRSGPLGWKWWSWGRQRRRFWRSQWKSQACSEWGLEIRVQRWDESESGSKWAREEGETNSIWEKQYRFLWKLMLKSKHNIGFWKTDVNKHQITLVLIKTYVNIKTQNWFMKNRC